MKKVNLIMPLLIAVLFVAGCSNKENKESASRLQYEDFSLYDHDGREIDFLTSTNNSISVYARDEEADSVQTYRGVRIGDRASTALAKYNLSDFDWCIKTDYIINADKHRAQADELEDKYKGLTSEEMLEHIPEITAIENMQIIFTCSVYEYEGQYYTYNNIPKKEGEIVHLSSLKSYHISIYVESEKIKGFVLSYKE